ncbi:small integral membrane protein 19-like isoform X1 [Eubalaena glacialis]|uniref:small integral membrane protein 19-like isoform X1 n=1 Tax=Eubalaena glacialis TaxID=27606 RepID=UPI002A5AB56A|nr:small integral membrane protein 19-like isoform X1 [Eubalaena glacialis]
MPGGYGVMGDEGSIDYSVHEAWNEATNVYLVVILVSFGLFMYVKRNKRKIMRIFSVPPPTDTLSEPNFYDTISKIRLRQQLEVYSISNSQRQKAESSPGVGEEGVGSYCVTRTEPESMIISSHRAKLTAYSSHWNEISENEPQK